jgi:hypothetical protein
MFTRVISAAVATALLSTTVPAFAAIMVKDVDVSVDLVAIENAMAAEHWTDIADDLENAIVGKLTDRIAEDGARISIDIDEVELANSWQSAMSVADSKLGGHVNISHESDNSAFDSYDLIVTFEQAGPFFLPGTDLTALTTDSKVYYDGMIAAFADYVVTHLK